MAAAKKETRTGRSRRRNGRHWSAKRMDLQRRIINDMLDGKYFPGKTEYEYAEEYQYTLDHIEHCTAEASRFIRLCRGDDLRVKERLIASIERATQLAVDAQKLHFSETRGEFRRAKQPNLSALRDFLRLQMDIHGFTCIDAKANPTNTDQVNVEIEDLSTILNQLGYKVTKDDTAADEEPARTEPGQGAPEGGAPETNPGAPPSEGRGD